MRTTYLIWKDPACNGQAPDWQEITGNEFLALVRSPEGKNRHFIKLASTNDDSGDETIVMESTKSEYVKWRKEKDHADYIRKYQQKSGYQVVSYHAIESANDAEGCTGEETLEDGEVNLEADFMKSVEQGLLKEALAQLSEDEYRLLEYFYMSATKGTVRKYSEITDLPIMTVQNRKKAILKKIKNFLEGQVVQIKI